MFPQLRNYNPSIFGYFDSDERDSVRTLRINTNEHFAKYFSFNFENTGDCVAQLDIQTLTSSQDYDKLNEIVKGHIGTKSLTQLLIRLTNEITEETLKSKFFETTLQILFDVSDMVSYDYQGLFANQEFHTLYYSTLNIIKRIGTSKADRLIPLLIQQSISVYVPVRLAYSIMNADKTDPFHQPIVSDAVIDSIKDDVILLIESKKEYLLEHPQFSFIFDCWYEWLIDKSNAAQYRNELYQDYSKLMTLMDKIQNKVHSSNRVEPVRYFDLLTKSATHDIELMHTSVLDLMRQHQAIYNANKIMVDRFISDYDDFKQGKKVDWSNIRE